MHDLEGDGHLLALDGTRGIVTFAVLGFHLIALAGSGPGCPASLTILAEGEVPGGER